MLFSSDKDEALGQIKRYCPVTMATDIDSLRPDIEYAEREFLLEVLGEEQYNALNDAYEDGAGSLSSEHQALLDKCQGPIANLAYGIYMAVGQLDISESGVRIVTDEGHKTAFQWQIEDVKNNYFFHKGYRQLDWLLEFLEKNKASYPLWVNSDAYTVNKSFLVATTDEFQAVYDIKRSRRLFVKLWPFMRRVEHHEIKPNISPAYYEALMTEVRAGNVSDDNKDVVKLLQPAVVELTIARAMEELASDLTELGIVKESAGVSGTTSKNITPAPASERQRKADAAQRNGEAYLKDAVGYLQANASETKYTTFFESERYVKPDADDQTPSVFKNDPDSQVFGAF